MNQPLKKVAHIGGSVAGNARKDIESKIGKKSLPRKMPKICIK